MSLKPAAAALLLGLLFVSGCSDDAGAPATEADAIPVDDAAADTGIDTAAGTAPDADVSIKGERKLSGTIFFFDATGVGAVDLQKGVTGAEVYLLEHPDDRQPVAADGTYTFADNAAGEYTVALVHPDYFPSLSPIIEVGDQDVEEVNFQAVTHFIATFLAAVVGAKPADKTKCQMVATVTAIDKNQRRYWAPGEPGATVTVDPPVPAIQGPFYFGTNVVPDKKLEATTTDGGVIVAGAKPGLYTWKAHKDGLIFTTQRLRCVGGWLTNAAPPFGLQASQPGG